ncbi:hypothetical protein [Psychroserpens sp.]|uniref:hypothetical protein n=1 Tax=Psychroserpens sp. TaxID=2020870 RepID=UPI001B25036A|nr:hypothetical protein [Psychroserpens sp.]MBO6632507.1 hypothetical protein [Psychroserpens sp.]MBO6653041.1 hypothetical protein [Psychroserpens sp.]MBO6914592.1 hypothetical protein [Psychroserpens sp.]MBO6941753.1 hypothetical protein [Psychroserpens sp.]
MKHIFSTTPKDELLGNWETHGINHFKVDQGYTLKFNTDGTGTFGIMDKVNGKTPYTEIAIIWERLSECRIRIAKADGSDAVELSYIIKPAIDEQFYSLCLMADSNECIGFWIIDQAVYKRS